MRRNLTYAGGRLVVAWGTEPRHEKIFRDIHNALDPKAGFDYLTPRQAGPAFRHFLNLDRPAGLSGLTPADFALPAKKAAILGVTEPGEPRGLLVEELGAGGLKTVRMGF
jgi:hypothetical protein